MPTKAELILGLEATNKRSRELRVELRKTHELARESQDAIAIMKVRFSKQNSKLNDVIPFIRSVEKFASNVSHGRYSDLPAKLLGHERIENERGVDEIVASQRVMRNNAEQLAHAAVTYANLLEETKS